MTNLEQHYANLIKSETNSNVTVRLIGDSHLQVINNEEPNQLIPVFMMLLNMGRQCIESGSGYMTFNMNV